MSPASSPDSPTRLRASFCAGFWHSLPATAKIRALSQPLQPVTRVAMNIKPLYDRVVIKRMEEEKMSAGGKVLFGKYSGTEVKLDGTEYLVVKEDDILAVIG